MPEPTRSSSPLLHRTLTRSDRPTRTLERAGQLWMVYEHTHPFDRRSSPDLVFESDAVVRRVRNYPVGWRELADDALWTLYGAR